MSNIRFEVAKPYSIAKSAKACCVLIALLLVVFMLIASSLASYHASVGRVGDSIINTLDRSTPHYVTIVKPGEKPIFDSYANLRAMLFDLTGDVLYSDEIALGLLYSRSVRIQCVAGKIVKIDTAGSGGT